MQGNARESGVEQSAPRIVAGEHSSEEIRGDLAALLERMRREPALRSWVLQAPTGALASLGVALDDTEIVTLLDRIVAMDQRPLPMTARDLMTPNPFTIRPEASVHDAAEMLTEHHISSLPVVDESGAIVGMVTEYDLVARGGETVRELMTPGVVTVAEEATVDEVRAMLVARKLKRLPVVDRQGALVGIISRADLVRELAYRWVCGHCGYVVRARRAPEQCPQCGTRGEFREAPRLSMTSVCPTCGRPLNA